MALLRSPKKTPSFYHLLLGTLYSPHIICPVFGPWLHPSAVFPTHFTLAIHMVYRPSNPNLTSVLLIISISSPQPFLTPPLSPSLSPRSPTSCLLPHPPNTLITKPMASQWRVTLQVTVPFPQLSSLGTPFLFPSFRYCYSLGTFILPNPYHLSRTESLWDPSVLFLGVFNYKAPEATVYSGLSHPHLRGSSLWFNEKVFKCDITKLHLQV